MNRRNAPSNRAMEAPSFRMGSPQFTDDVIRGDGTHSPVPGSNADTADIQDDLIDCAKNTGVMLAPVDEPNRCPACSSYRTEDDWGSPGYRQCNECGMVF